MRKFCHATGVKVEQCRHHHALRAKWSQGCPPTRSIGIRTLTSPLIISLSVVCYARFHLITENPMPG
jgi:hypothetical protein